MRILLLIAALLGVLGAARAEEARFEAISNPNLGLGLMGVHDWSPEQPFLDVMKTARPWIGHRPSAWGGMEEADLRAVGALDAGGWPLFIPPGLEAIGTVILTDLPEGAMDTAGRYLVTWQGQGRLELRGRAANVAGTEGRITFDFTPGPGLVEIRITATDPADPLRRIRVVREDRAALADAGEIFNPDFLARLHGVRLLRFMDWLATNDSTLAAPEDRPLPGDYTWARHGVPVEVAVALANRLGADAWITVPHLAQDDLVREMAQVVARDLDPGLRAWVEFSNEVWNWQFRQAHWAEAEGLKRWGAEGAWVSFYALRATEVMEVWTGEMPPERVVRVIATQTGWPGLEEAILTPPLILENGGAPPYQSFDAYAVTGYFSSKLGYPERQSLVRAWLDDSRAAAREQGASLGLGGEALEAWTLRHGMQGAVEKAVAELRDGSLSGDPNDSLAHLTGTLFPYHAGVAARHGLRLVMYEGGTHVTGIGPVAEDEEMTAFFTELNYSAGMGELYGELLAGWRAVTDAPFTHYGSVFTPGRYGSWGGLRHLSDDNPRWRALIRGCAPC
ncbi:hypothetical protein [Pseudogemmobacter humi]|nr:hypothetical protein [Pseudogemmobacter humi]